MAVNDTTQQDYLLPCGRELEQVWERLDAVEAGYGDEHDATCPHCRAARESLLALRAATRELIDRPEEPPPGLTGRIMSAVRSEVRRGRTLELPAARIGGVEISEQAVSAILRYAADSVPGVRARRCRIRGVTEGLGREYVAEGLGREHVAEGPGREHVAEGPGRERLVDVEMTIAIRAGGASVGELLPKVRSRITAALPEHVGVGLRRLDVHVGDLYHERDPAPSVENGSGGRR